MGDNPSKFQDGWSAGLRPVETISMNDVDVFLKRLNANGSEYIGLKGMWRLPTEAEWEYVAKAGTTTRWSFGNKDSELAAHGWHGPAPNGQHRTRIILGCKHTHQTSLMNSSWQKVVLGLQNPIPLDPHQGEDCEWMIERMASDSDLSGSLLNLWINRRHAVQYQHQLRFVRQDFVRLEPFQASCSNRPAPVCRRIA